MNSNNFISLPTSGEFWRSLMTFANSFDPDEAQQRLGSNLGYKLFDTKIEHQLTFCNEIMQDFKVWKNQLIKVHSPVTVDLCSPKLIPRNVMHLLNFPFLNTLSTLFCYAIHLAYHHPLTYKIIYEKCEYNIVQVKQHTQRASPTNADSQKK